MTQRVLITGGAGFIGSHLAETLLDAGLQVAVLDDLSTGRFENIAHLTGHPNFSFAIDSITNAIVLDRLASESDAIIHLAAAVGVKLVVEQPVHTIETNIMGAEAVLKAAARYRAKVIIASTSEVYGKGAHVPFREDDDVVLGPTSRTRWAYAASKMVDEFLALAYHQKYDLPVVIARLFNTVGPRQTGRYGMVVPRFVRQALAGEPITVYGDGSQSRCFCDVSDTVRALKALLSHEEAVGKVFNVGSTEEVAILELAQRIKALTGSDSSIRFVPYAEAYAPGFEDMQRRVPDTTRIQSVTGWRPRYDLDAILQRVIVWLKRR
ncbi:MAG TPA: NAD-dependent epimerase/dehydratase family protein [Anaerolineae bacterium]|nr:NAD-dependent epimerase/dehydratase family protein [Caldilineae bacterium]HID35540.1 NAD-dependent epimerase/dehydratase family protein [Anaerolineae bacterium]